MILCPCGSGNNYSFCCEQYISGSQIAKMPEQLMRSRYSAYTQGNVEYIFNSMRYKALRGFDKDSVKRWALHVTWLKLDVIHSYNQDIEHGFVEFSAIFMQKNNKLQEIHELSEFKLENGRWYYIDGKILGNTNKYVGKKIPVNLLCPCGSGRKFKFCHMLTK